MCNDCFENCVSCGCNTFVKIDTPVDDRGPYYIVGVGQLCFDCYNNLYKKKPDLKDYLIDVIDGKSFNDSKG